MQYRFASAADIPLLTDQRLRFLEIAKTNPDHASMQQNLLRYFNDAFAADTIDVLLAETGGQCIGTGIVFYYQSVPSTFNPEGKNAYLTSMYVAPEYRRQGVATAMVNRLMDKAKHRGYPVIMLNASEMGRPLYEKLGFRDIQNGMILDIRNA